MVPGVCWLPIVGQSNRQLVASNRIRTRHTFGRSDLQTTHALMLRPTKKAIKAMRLRPRLLLVEDDARRVELFSRWLQDSEFVLVAAQSGGQALGMLSKGFDGVAGLMLDHDLSDAPLTTVDRQMSSSDLLPLLQRLLPRHVPVLIHSHNLNKPVTMQRALERSGHKVSRIRFSALEQETKRFDDWLQCVRDNWDPECFPSTPDRHRAFCEKRG